MKWWHIIVMVVAAILCLIGVVLWITMGVVLTNPPDGSKCTSFPFQRFFPFLPHFIGQKGGVVMMYAKPHPLMYSYTIAQVGHFLCVC